MPKPTELPRWADVGGDIVEPLEAKKDIGWVDGEQPPAEYFNWLLNLLYLWTFYLDTFEDEQHTWTQTQEFEGEASDIVPPIYFPHVPTVRALVLEQEGPAAVGNFRVYVGDSVEFTINAVWDGANWDRDVGATMMRFRFRAGGDRTFDVQNMNGAGPHSDATWGTATDILSEKLDTAKSLLHFCNTDDTQAGGTTRYLSPYHSDSDADANTVLDDASIRLLEKYRLLRGPVRQRPFDCCLTAWQSILSPLVIHKLLGQALL
jgi:hypothetical protein